MANTLKRLVVSIRSGLVKLRDQADKQGPPPISPCTATRQEMHYMWSLEHGQKPGVTVVQLMSDLLVKLNQAQVALP